MKKIYIIASVITIAIIIAAVIIIVNRYNAKPVQPKLYGNTSGKMKAVNRCGPLLIRIQFILSIQILTRVNHTPPAKAILSLFSKKANGAIMIISTRQKSER
ncbi:MAG: hypothetical protein HYW78_02020 [Parcubacteria group bacterium]|nr:hypothetical protein [Parcubacteria group bacterium]